VAILAALMPWIQLVVMYPATGEQPLTCTVTGLGWWRNKGRKAFWHFSGFAAVVNLLKKASAELID